MTLPPLYPQGYLCRPITSENRPAGVTSLGAAPPPLADNALRKRAEKRLCMGAESATVLNCKGDKVCLPPWILAACRSEILSA